MATGLAAPLTATGQESVPLHDPAVGKDHLVTVAPAKFPEQFDRLLFTEGGDAPSRQRTRLDCGQKMLGHGGLWLAELDARKR